MADEKKSLILDLLARNKMRKDTQDAADDLDKLGRSAEDADKKTESLGTTSEKTGKQTTVLGETIENVSQETDKLGDSTTKASKATDKMGNSLSDTKGRISGLDREIESVNKELSGMSAQFADAQTKSERLDISKAIRRTETELKKLSKSKSILESLIPDENDNSWKTKFASSFKGVFSQIGEMGGPEIAVALAGASPLIGAALSGAVIGGAGIGGIVGGFLIASKDPRVQSAAAVLKTDIGNELKDAAAPFIPVTIGAIGRVDQALKGINFKGIFSDAAKESGPLIDGVVHLITKLGTSVGDLIHNSGPEVEAIGNGIAKIGDSLGNGLESLANNGKDSTNALNSLFSLISGGIDVTFKLVDGLTKVYGVLYDIGFKLGEGAGKALEFFGVQGDAVHGTLMKVSQSSIDAASSANKLKAAQDAAAKATAAHTKAAQDLNNELKGEVDPEFALLNAIDGVTEAKKADTDATKKYGAGSEQAKQATRNLVDAAITLQGAATGAGGAIDGKLTPSMRNTLKAAKLTDSQIAAVEKQLKSAKKAADSYAGTYRAYVQVIFKEPIGKSYLPGGADFQRESTPPGAGKRAAGGPIVRGMPYIVGENGPEMIIPDASGRVLSAGASRGLIAQSAVSGMRGSGGGGGGARTVQLEVAGPDARLVSLLKYLIRTANVIET
jgi:archaellum component FlaC